MNSQKRGHGNNLMCESTLESEGLVCMTGWWTPVRVTSRISIVGYASHPAHKTEDVQQYADAFDPGQPPKISDSANGPKRPSVMMCYVVTSWIWMLFLFRHRTMSVVDFML